MNSKIFIKIVAILVLLCSANSLQAQQDPEYSQYMFNQMSYNPAYAGARDALSGVFLLRKQWVGLDGAPATGNISFHTPSQNLRHGFGINLIHDRLGITRQNFLTASYAYRLSIGTGRLALGLRGGITHFTNQFTELNPLSNDQLNPGMNLSMVLPRFGTGIHLSWERFYIGASVPNLLTPLYQFDELVSQTVSAKQQMHYFATMGAAIPISEKLDFRPSIVAKYVENAPGQLDLNAAIFYNQFLWLGLGYRTSDAIIGMVELNFPSGLRIGYAYDFTITKLGDVNSGSHELMLGFDLGLSKQKIVTPRYF